VVHDGLEDDDPEVTGGFLGKDVGVARGSTGASSGLVGRCLGGNAEVAHGGRLLPPLCAPRPLPVVVRSSPPAAERLPSPRRGDLQRRRVSGVAGRQAYVTLSLLQRPPIVDPLRVR
jgi:hypothetical protein